MATARTAISEVNSSPKVPPGVSRSQRKRGGAEAAGRAATIQRVAAWPLHPADRGAPVLRDSQEADAAQTAPTTTTISVAEQEGARPA